ncbi:MAG: FAD-dependent monooxygenase [bacterium]|nr:FAD-dependent monooxygenase [bacterium]
MSSSTTTTHAIVTGGSMAGLLAARVLSERFDRVTIIERDELPHSGDYRGGVPQARHLHTLLVRGAQIMEELFPGFGQTMLEEGAVPAHWGKQTHFITTGGYVKRFESGIHSNAMARANLEWLVRRKVMELANIDFISETQVEGLLANEDRSVVTGVRVLSRADKSSRELYADLVVDASGRPSKAPEWLVELGYDAPQETMVRAHAGYATRWYEIPENTPFHDVTYIIQPRAGEGLYRGGGLMKVEGNRWVVTLIGANKDYPPTDEEGFMAFAASLADKGIYELIKTARPISQIYGYRRLENRMRHYEKLARRPENFLVTGDAAVAFNPIYGQGMTAAALEAMLLRKLVAKHDPRQLKGLAATFQKGVNKLAQGPWLMNTSEDARYPDVEGMKNDFITRFTNRYFDLVALAMPYDTAVSKRFIEAMNLLKPPSSLMYPGIMLRVLRHTLLPHRYVPQRDVRVTAEVATVNA